MQYIMFEVLYLSVSKNIYLYLYQLVNKKGVKPYNFSFSVFMIILIFSLLISLGIFSSRYVNPSLKPLFLRASIYFLLLSWNIYIYIYIYIYMRAENHFVYCIEGKCFKIIQNLKRSHIECCTQIWAVISRHGNQCVQPMILETGVQSQVKDSKIVLDATLVNIQHYNLIKVKKVKNFLYSFLRITNVLD